MILSLNRRVLGVALLVTSLSLVACQSSNTGGSAASGSAMANAVSPSAAAATPRASGEAGVETSVFDLETGDCFGAAGESVESVLVVPCEESHIYEAFAILQHPAGDDEPYPGEEEMINSSDAACQEPFEAYVGRDYQSSEFFITTIYPSEQTWAQADREIVCTVATENEDEVTGSAEGSGR